MYIILKTKHNDLRFIVVCETIEVLEFINIWIGLEKKNNKNLQITALNNNSWLQALAYGVGAEVSHPLKVLLLYITIIFYIYLISTLNW